MPQNENTAPEPDSLKQFMGMAKQASAQQRAQQPTVEMYDNAAVMKIYGNMKWSLKTRDWTYKELDELLANTIHEVEASVQTPAIREKAIAKFQEARAKLSEFTVEQPDELAEKCDLCGIPTLACVCGLHS